jgi:demethylmenaquinone methyltransferase/2-methoxy-6-polyprenyl-1,4-benzoquinol methylase
MSEQVKQMFADIAKDYDKMNDILSFKLHHLWRKKVVRLSEPNKINRVLDCASGTGDLAIEFKKAIGKKDSQVIATDFCFDMLEYIPEKAKKNGVEVEIEVQDVMNLPYDDNYFDVSTISFGIRNVDDPKKGIDEMARVVRSGGKVIVLETGQPKGINKLFYKIYGKFIMPMLGKLIAKNEAAYKYLPETASKFPYADEFVSIMNSTQRFSRIEYFPQSFGVSYIYVGTVK